ncbi:MAG: FumA C-terminus/TtdB family hydratase beta subunit [Clostridiales bacterium]|nr:FumA C-terminus/TtdB family hydratase beta subunit [Clostridiales bacterium]
MKNIVTPLDPNAVRALQTGDMALLSGRIYTARDAAHQKMADLIREGKEPPFPFQGEAVFYAGPCPAPPGKVIGSVGPTTSGRMDVYAPLLIACGLKIMIGKGQRSQPVKDAIIENGGIYFAAIGGAAALIAQCVKSSEIVAFEELGTEAIRRLIVENLPLVVAIDARGRDIYEHN